LLARNVVANPPLEYVPLDFSSLRGIANAIAYQIAEQKVDVVNSHASGDRRALTLLRWHGRLKQAFVVTRRTMRLTMPPELIAVGLTADRTIAVSAAVARGLRRRLHPGGRLRVVPNGLSQGLLEAMTLGVPVIASVAGGNGELVVPGETGLMVPPLDPAAWTRALERMLGDDEFRARVARAGQTLARSEFTMARTADRTEVVYREAVASR
jgi:hypothetical protein